MPGALEVVQPGKQATEHRLRDERRRRSCPRHLTVRLLTGRLLTEQAPLQSHSRVDHQRACGSPGSTGRRRVVDNIRGGNKCRLRCRHLAADQKIIQRQIDSRQELGKMLLAACNPVQRTVMIIVKGFAQGHQARRDRLGADRIVAWREVGAAKQGHKAKIDAPQFSGVGFEQLRNKTAEGDIQFQVILPQQRYP